MKNRKVSPKSRIPVRPSVTPPSSPAGVSGALAVTICLSISVVTLLVYFQSMGHGFVFYDDDRYVYENAMLKTGVSIPGLSWAFGTFYYANWHPLTWVSYLLDYQLFGLNAGAEHAVNVALHVGAMALLFWALLAMTRQPWRCALVAGIFALHPLHVESVAWISERKDVLSTFFQMLTLLLYARYAAKPAPKRYAAMALTFAFSLMAKPMAVTLPLVLLLLDLWPLGRIKFETWRSSLQRPIWEKAPLLAMSAIASVLTFLAQRSGGAVASLVHVPITRRLANAAAAYLGYIGKAFWPVDLAVLYPLRSATSEAVFGAVVILIAVTALAVATIRSRPYILVGWLWYLGMLVPVIGLVQVGRQSMADRYTYMPLVGLSIALVWSVAEAVERRPSLRQPAAALTSVVMLILAVGAYHQAAYWKDSETLFRHTLAVTRDNSIIENNLGVVLLGQAKYDEAVKLFAHAVAIDPDYADAHANLGRQYLRTGQMPEAFKQLSEALRLKADSAEPQGDMGLVLASAGRYEEASKHLEESLRLAPDRAEAQSNFCFILQQLGRLDQAIAACETALRLKPDFPNARFNLGMSLAAKGKTDAAIAELSRVPEGNPNYDVARTALMELRKSQGH